MPVARCNGARGGGGLSPLREQRAGAAWSGAWCRAEKSCKGGPRARAGPRSVCVCVCVWCVCARACAWQRLGYGNSRGSSCRPRDSAAPEADGRGLLSAPRPLAPVDARAPAHKRREREKGEREKGEEGGQKGGEVGAALPPSRRRSLCPPGNGLLHTPPSAYAALRTGVLPGSPPCSAPPGWEPPARAGLSSAGRPV